MGTTYKGIILRARPSSHPISTLISKGYLFERTTQMALWMKCGNISAPIVGRTFRACQGNTRVSSEQRDVPMVSTPRRFGAVTARGRRALPPSGRLSEQAIPVRSVYVLVWPPETARSQLRSTDDVKRARKWRQVALLPAEMGAHSIHAACPMAWKHELRLRNWPREWTRRPHVTAREDGWMVTCE